MKANEISSLTKENFFDAMKGLYPEAMKLFSEWIDKYKEEVNWENLFLNNRRDLDKNYKNCDIKFHNLPIDMQMGILYKFFREQLKEMEFHSQSYNIDWIEYLFRRLNNK